MNLQNQINYLKEFFDQDMFDGCSVPAPLNMERVRGAIVMRCGLLTPLYSEPEVQRAATQQFFFENQWNFDHIVKVIEAEYSPIENVSEWRDESQTGETTHTTTKTRGETEQHAGTDGRRITEGGTTQETEGGTTTTAEGGTTQTTEGGATTTTNEISAENATAYQADNKSTEQHGKTDTVTHGRSDTITHGKTDTVTHGKTTNDDLTHGELVQRNSSETVTDRDSGDRGLTMHRHGNVGITTNTALINEELNLLERFNPYKFIADLYERQLMVGLY